MRIHARTVLADTAALLLAGCISPQLGPQPEVFANGRSRGVVEDAGFARLFVELYLGDNPPTVALRDALLGRG